MNPVLFAKILIRVLSVYLIAEGIIFLAQTAPAYLYALRETLSGRSGYTLYFIFSATSFVTGGLLWAVASRLAEFMVGHSAATRDSTLLSLESALGAIISVSGLLIVAVYLPHFLSALMQNIANLFQPIVFGTDRFLVAESLRLAFGLALFLGAGTWVRIIKRLRAIGVDETPR